MNLDAYFARIGYTGTPKPDLATLAELVEHHVTSVPFENLDVLLGRPPKLDLASLAAKLVGARRGGYCYEHATLFAHVLERIGFTVHRHSARVTMTVPKSQAPRTHMFLTVELPGGTFVVDPGFGFAPRVPLDIDGTPGGEHWIARDGADLALMGRTRDKVITAWVSTLERDYPIDFEMANHFTATSPLSAFTTGLMMRAFTPEGGRVTVRGRTVTHFPSEQTRELATGAELRALCREHFGFDLPALDTLALP